LIAGPAPGRAAVLPEDDADGAAVAGAVEAALPLPWEVQPARVDAVISSVATAAAVLAVM
jgi:hypothetical protein